MRGFTLVVTAVPALAAKTLGSCDTVPPVPDPGSRFANCGWFNTLKNSPRIWMVVFSVILVVLRIEKSKFTCPGPGRMPIPVLPNNVAQVGQAAWVVVVTPSGMMAGAGQKALTLK